MLLLLLLPHGSGSRPNIRYSTKLCFFPAIRELLTHAPLFSWNSWDALGLYSQEYHEHHTARIAFFVPKICSFVFLAVVVHRTADADANANANADVDVDAKVKSESKIGSKCVCIV